MQLDKLKPDFLRYLAEHPATNGETLPTLADIGVQMGVSVGKLREQLELARYLGFISIRPRVGMKRERFDFMPAVLPSLLYSMATGEASFLQFSQLRQTLEASLWPQAVTQLTVADKERLRAIIARAWSKLKGEPVHVPNQEHRELHMTIFSHLDNPFVQGILNAYWEAYEASELTRLADYGYWLQVWKNHEQIVDALCRNDFDEGFQILIAHFKLLPTLSLPPNGASEH